MPADRGPDFAAWALGTPLTALLGLVLLAQVATWLPHYLTWPYWADHDVFAHAARAWDLGEKPYRDVRQNNFPGTIYLFYVIGKLAGWGRPGAFYAFDAGLLATLVGVLLAWSRRQFGRILPGLIGSGLFLSVYLGLDYSHAAQRDWQGPCLVVLALLAVQGWPGRGSRVASAFLAAMALAIRPQVVLLLPALFLTVVGDGTAVGRGRWMRRGAGWCLAFAGFTALAFAPLVMAGVFGDFLQSLKLVAYGSAYNRTGPGSVVRAWMLQASAWRWLVVPAAVILLGSGGDRRNWMVARVWLVALAGVSFYKPISPIAHSYLDIPLVLIWSANVAVLAGLLLSATATPAPVRLAAVIGLLGLGESTIRASSCAVGPSLRSVATLGARGEPAEAPPGYRRGTVATSAFYPWADYRALLAYLRRATGPTTRIANVLKGDPAVVSTVDRRSAFPAESIAWLRMVNPRDEAAFVESLGRAEDAVVLWVPGEVGPDPGFRIDRLTEAIPRLFVFEARFGRIEVWRRRGGPASTPP